MKNLRKMLSILMLSFIVFSLIPRVAFAQGREALTSVNLNFRDKGTVYSNIIGVIPAGKTLTITQTSGNWSEVSFEDKTGWVATKYLTETAVTVQTLTNLKEAALKTEPASTSKNLASLAKGSQAKVLEILKDWYKVDVDGKVGYVFSANWIDSPLVAPAAVKEPVVSSDAKYEVYGTITVYMNAVDADEMRNSVGSYPAGEYHIYKNYSGMLNVTRHAGVPGAWINPAQNQDSAPAAPQPVTKPDAPVKQPASEPAAPAPETAVAEKYSLIATVNTYTNAYDAQNDTNRVGRFVAGEYLVYKKFAGMVNLTKMKDVPGSWINPEANTETPAAVEPKPEAAEPKPEAVEPKPEAQKPVVEKPAEQAQPNTIVANGAVNLRKNASNLSEVLSTLPSGTSAVLIGRESNWLKIEYKDQIGYSYIDLWTVPEATLEQFPSKTTVPSTSTAEPAEEAEPVTEPAPVEVKPSGKLKVYLDPGHNGVGLGAVSTVTGEMVDETTINFNVALLAKTILEDRGYEVYLSKYDLNESVTLAERAAKANALNVDIFVSIHGNAYTNSAAKGTIGFYAGEKTTPSTSDWQAKSMLLSRTLSESVGRIFGSGKIVKDTSYGTSFAVNRLSNMASVLLELGFITNFDDATIMNSSARQKDIAYEIANGIDKYFGK